MKEADFFIMYQSSNLCDALHRNVNDNFVSVSFRILENDNILVKVVLEKKTETENALIDDMIAEFSAVQERNCVEGIEVYCNMASLPYENLVYSRA